MTILNIHIILLYLSYKKYFTNFLVVTFTQAKLPIITSSSKILQTIHENETASTKYNIN